MHDIQEIFDEKKVSHERKSKELQHYVEIIKSMITRSIIKNTEMTFNKLLPPFNDIIESMCSFNISGSFFKK